MGYDKKDAEKALKVSKYLCEKNNHVNCQGCANDLPNAVCCLYKQKLIHWKPKEQNGKKSVKNNVNRDATEMEMRSVLIYIFSSIALFNL